MASIIQIRRDTAANWTSANPTLAQGELGFETDTLKLKLGDGSTAWTSLSYYTGGQDHGNLTGLADDDHTQYHTDARGDARYSLLSHNHSGIYEPADATILKDADIGSTVQAYDADIPTIAASQAEMEAGTETALRSMSPANIKQSIQAIAGDYPAIRPSLLLDFANSQAIDRRITFSRNSTATRVNKNGLIESVAANQPRIDFDPITGECKGLLIEEQRTNLLTYSEQFDNAAWTKHNASITANTATAPDGTVTADKIIADSVNTWHNISITVSVTSGVQSTISLFIKAGEYYLFEFAFIGSPFSISPQVVFDLSNGTVANSNGIATRISVEDCGDGWFRCSMTVNPESSGTAALALNIHNDPSTANDVFTGNNVNGLYIWGAQLEAGPFPTSYIPTTSTTVTRLADSATMTGTNFSEWYNPLEGTIVTEASVPAFSATSVVEHDIVSLTTSSGVGVNRITVRAYSSGDGALVFDSTIRASSTVYFDSGGKSASAEQPVKTALMYAVNDCAEAIDGALGSTDTSVTLPTCDRAIIGSRNIHIKNIAYYPKRLTNLNGQALTTG